MSENYKDLARAMIKQHEGLILSPYRCTAEKLTIGYGRNLDANGITVDTANQMLNEDIATAEFDAKKFIGARVFAGLSDGRKAVLIDMAFNLGYSRLSAFKNLRATLIDGNYSAAADEMTHSRWYSQVGNRAVDLVQMMEAG